MKKRLLLDGGLILYRAVCYRPAGICGLGSAALSAMTASKLPCSRCDSFSCSPTGFNSVYTTVIFVLYVVYRSPWWRGVSRGWPGWPSLKISCPSKIQPHKIYVKEKMDSYRLCLNATRKTEAAEIQLVSGFLVTPIPSPVPPTMKV